MAQKSELLDRLVIPKPCTAPWDEMVGDERRRRCAHCERDVFDLSQMTAEEVRAQIEASRGHLCGRITRRGTDLIFRDAAPEPLVEAPSAWAERRASPLAATLLSAWLGAGAVAALPLPSGATGVASPAGTASVPDVQGEGDEPAVVHGRVVDENGEPIPGVTVWAESSASKVERTVTDPQGNFTFPAIAPGRYDVQARLEGFDFEPINEIVIAPGEVRRVELLGLVASDRTLTIIEGDVAVEVSSLRALFERSDLVVRAVVRSHRVLSSDPLLSVVATELAVQKTWRGKAESQRIQYRHSIWNSEVESLATGGQVLAFLDSRSGSVYEAAEPISAIKEDFSSEALAAYGERLDALSTLDQKARRGEQEPAEWMEWVVATIEEPLTRGEALSDLRRAFYELETPPTSILPSLLQSAARGEEEKLLLSASQRQRLTAALQSSPTIEASNLELFSLVRKWDDLAATTWLADRLREATAETAGLSSLDDLEFLAQRIEDEALTELVDAASDREDEIDELWEDDESEAAEKRRDALKQELAKELRQAFAEALTGDKSEIGSLSLPR